MSMNLSLAGSRHSSIRRSSIRRSTTASLSRSHTTPLLRSRTSDSVSSFYSTTTDQSDEANQIELSEAELARISTNHEMLLEFVEACSKASQKSWVFDLQETMRVSRLQGKAEYLLQQVVQQRHQMMDPAGHSYSSVKCDFQIKETPLSHDYDLLALKQRVLDMFQWYENDNVRRHYLAPYIPLIQSSGMGKTKLLYELRQHLNRADEAYHARLILCASGGEQLEGDMKQTYDTAVEMEECMKREPDPTLKYKEVEKEMTNLCQGHNGRPIVLLFDEAQNLLVGKDNHLFNCIQWWLCKKNKYPIEQVVAVFCGTTLQFAVTPREPPESHDWGNYWMDGYQRYPPFFELHTMGCLLEQKSSVSSDDNNNNEFESEYDESIYYGRPLFAKMGQHDLLGEDSEADILRRLVLSHVENWHHRVDSCFSVLAVRVQMGQTSFQIASQLVSRGYAILSSLDPEQGIAEVCHLPDPVCARLAMCYMCEDFKCDVLRQLHGRSRKFWVDQMANIFANQTCIPSAGDVGEVFAAMFLLFCGDILRFDYLPDNDEVTQFSVPLSHWIFLLLNGGHEAADESEWPATSTDDNGDFKGASVCFIQVTQNFLRFQVSMSAWTQQHFLEHLYKSRSAFYVFEDCSVFDIFGSICINGSGDSLEPRYVPLLISIVSLPKISPSEATSACCAMEMLLTTARCDGGLCLLLVLGRTDTATEFDDDLLLQLEDLESISDEIVAKVVEIKKDDAFGITEKLWTVTSSSTEVAEIYASHSYLRWHHPGDAENLEFLRTGKRPSRNHSLDNTENDEGTEGMNGHSNQEGDDSDEALLYLEEIRDAIGGVERVEEQTENDGVLAAVSTLFS